VNKYNLVTMPDPSHLERRTVLKAAVSAWVCIGIAPVALSAQEDPALRRPQENDLLVRDDDSSLTPLRPEDLPLGAAQVMAWAIDPATGVARSGTRLNRVLLLRLEEGHLSPDTRSRAADGVVAYTAICTHNGCEVVEWVSDEQALSCPCHGTEFDPKDGGRVIDGPAPRPLPALPLKVVDGKLTVAKPFTTRVGFESA
jgi:rieske iron-sulfur protein